MPKLFEDAEPFEYVESVSPPGGWQEPTCSFDSHSWQLEVEEGNAIIRCTDPCDESLFNPSSTPLCLHDWDPCDFVTPEPISVKVTYVDDSTKSGPWGPAEYGYYLEVRSKHDDEVHVAEFREHSFGLQHPTSCRPNLIDCPLNRAIEELDEAPGLGHFQVSLEDGKLQMTPVCDHEWVDARNEAVISGEFCHKCGALQC